MSALNDIVANLPVDQLASELGTDPATVQRAAGPAIASLLGGLTQNAQNPEGEQQLAQALQQHSEREVPSTLAQVDAGEGEKILGHVFGNQTDGVATALSSQAGVSNELVKKLLPMLAPIVMAYLAKQLTGQAGANIPGGNILGQVLGNAMGQGTPANQGVLGGVLSQVLGQVLGGQAAPTSNPLDPSTAQATAQQAQSTGGDIVSQILGGLLHKKN